MDKIYYQPNHLWKGQKAVKKLRELSGEKSYVPARCLYICIPSQKTNRKQVDQCVSAMFLHPHYNVLPKSRDHDPTDHNIPLSLGI